MTMTVDVRGKPLDLAQLLAGIGATRFFAEYWQRRTLVLDIGANRAAFELGDVEGVHRRVSVVHGFL